MVPLIWLPVAAALLWRGAALGGVPLAQARGVGSSSHVLVPKTPARTAAGLAAGSWHVFMRSCAAFSSHAAAAWPGDHWRARLAAD